MNVVTLDVRSLAESLNDFAVAWKNGRPDTPRVSFESAELLFKAISGKRWELLRALAGAGPMTIREAARRLGRDVKAVHGDVHSLLSAGVLVKTEDGRIEFPYDDLHVDFMLKAA